MDGFVEVVVEATGNVEVVPEHWIGDPVLGRGITPVEQPDTGDIDPVPVAGPPSEVQLVAGDESDLPRTQVGRDALDASAPVAVVDEPVKPKRGRSRSTTDTGGTESPDETPAAGEEEN